MHGTGTQTDRKLTCYLSVYLSSLTSFLCFSGPHGAKHGCLQLQNAHFYTPRTQKKDDFTSFPCNDSSWPNFMKCPPEANQIQQEVGLKNVARLLDRQSHRCRQHFQILWFQGKHVVRIGYFKCIHDSFYKIQYFKAIMFKFISLNNSWQQQKIPK